jgi:hypothetical protein
MHPAFPFPDDNDAEDVAWGLTTGAALWKQGERYDAIVWLKRAVDAATQAGLSARADELNRAATELLASLSGRVAPPETGVPLGGMPPLPPPKPPPLKPGAGGPQGHGPPPPPPSPIAAAPQRRDVRHFPPLPAGPPPRTPPPSRLRPFDEPPSSDRPQPSSERDSRPNPALIDAAIREALLHSEPPPPALPIEDGFSPSGTKREPFQTEVDEETEVEDVEDETIPLPSLPIMLESAPPAAEPPSIVPLHSVPISLSPVASEAPSSMPPAPPSLTPVRPRAQPPGGSISDMSPSHVRSSPLPPATNTSARMSQIPSAWGSSPAAPFRQSPLPQLPPSVAPPPISLDALGQLSPEHREALLRAATIESLGPEEEVTVSGLAFVITGQASIQATIAEASAGVLHAGELLYAKSPILETVSLRLVAEAEGTQIALWDAKTAEEALSAAPELLERLKIASARAQAIVGCSMGAMGERLDDSLRTLAMERLETRILQPHEVLASAGLPVPGLVIVGVGTVDLDDDGAETTRDKLVPGDFLFATEVLGAEPAPTTARAGTRGAIVLFGARGVAHELLVSCPPLLEIFAGM